MIYLTFLFVPKMSDPTLQVNITSKLDPAGIDAAKSGVDELRGKAEQTGAAVNDSLSAGSKGADELAGGFNRMGKALQNALGGNLTGAMKQLGGMTESLKAQLGAVGLAIAGVSFGVKKFQEYLDSLNADRLADIDRASEAVTKRAEMMAHAFKRAGEELNALAKHREALAGLVSEVGNISDEIAKAQIETERARELAATSDETERSRINEKHDRRLADLGKATAERGIDDERAKIQREREALDANDELIRQQMASEKTGRRQRLLTIEQLNSEGDDASHFWHSGMTWNRAKRVENAQGFYDKARAEQDKNYESLNRTKELGDQLKANERARELLNQREAEVIPQMEQRASAQSEQSYAKLDLNETDTRRGENERAEEKRKKQAEQQAREDEARKAVQTASERDAAAFLANQNAQSNAASLAQGLTAGMQSGTAKRGDYDAAQAAEKAADEAEKELKQASATLVKAIERLAKVTKDAAQHANTATADLGGAD